MNKKTLAVVVSVVALVLVAALMVGVYLATRPDPSEGQKEITVRVVHSDGTEKEFVYETEEKYLGPVLQENGLVEGDMGEFGLYITAVDGETADYSVNQSFWAVYIGEESATTGIDSIAIFDGDSFSLVYTIG